jgi:hypothetical protein
MDKQSQIISQELILKPAISTNCEFVLSILEQLKLLAIMIEERGNKK